MSHFLLFFLNALMHVVSEPSDSSKKRTAANPQLLALFLVEKNKKSPVKRKNELKNPNTKEENKKRRIFFDFTKEQIKSSCQCFQRGGTCPTS